MKSPSQAYHSISAAVGMCCMLFSLPLGAGQPVNYLIGEAMGEAMKELTAAAAPRPAAPAPMHLFRSAEGSKNFKGQLQGYDAATKKVTVRREDGRVIKFDLQHLHPDDQEFVTSGGKGGAETTTIAQ